MDATLPRRASYRVRQFIDAVAAYARPLTADERGEAHAVLPAAARSLFDHMPRNDQRHSLEVLRAVQAAGWSHPALLQAALLHDAAKGAGGITLLHRAAVVLIRSVRPLGLAQWAERAAPRRSDLRYPFWAHVHHPRLGAELAAAVGCEPLAVELIMRHQAHPPTMAGDALADELLAALQAADDDH